MATAELQAFLEDRLLALDPTTDLTSGSPAQTKFIQPVLTYLGTDPFETDIDSFITDRFAQEFPDIYADDPGALRDIFINPLRLLLEPFKRETASIKKNQSLIDPSVLSDDDADALVANVFDSRDQGGYAVGAARLYFANPTDVRIEVANRVYTGSNLNFFPTNPVAISAEAIVFNRDGSFFFMDIPLRAENPGATYNIDKDQIAGIDGVPNVVKLTNLQPFTGGSDRQDTISFVSSAEESLTERSLVTRRGATARLNTVFKGAIRSVQVIGAKDSEMQRDLLVAASPGHAWITGNVEIYQQVAYVRARTIEGAESSVPQVGDTLCIYLPKTTFPGVSQIRRFVRLYVDELLFGPSTTSGEFQTGYFVRWSDPDGNLSLSLGASNIQSAFFDLLPLSFEGGFSKKGSVRVTSLPDIDPVDLTVNNGEVHLYGRTDIYVRPTTQNSSQVTVDGLYDLGKIGSTTASPHFYLERLSLVTQGGSNEVSDVTSSFDFIQAGVEVGNILSIEEGSDAGFYVVGGVSSSVLYLNQVLTTASPVNGLRYRILKNTRIDPFDVRIIRFPFGDVQQRDLRTTIGSNLVTTSQSDLIQFGAKAGDTLQILEGPDAGSYIIQSFDSILGGQGIYLDKQLTATGYDLLFEVFTALDSVQLPLVRIRELLLLDSTHQSTGLTIPPADPVAVIPTGAFTSAKVLGVSQLPSGYVIPDLSTLVPVSNHAAPDAASSDRRYSMGFDTPDGKYISLVFADSSYSELDLRSDSQGKTSFFMATTEVFDSAINTPPIDPKQGECLTIKNGPNAGSYVIRAVYKFKYKVSTLVTAYVYFIQIYGTFPVDPLKRVIEFLTQHGQATGLESPTYPIAFPSFFQDWYTALGGKVRSALLALGITSPPAGSDLQLVVEAMEGCYYEWGLPARGVLRSYFREPTLFEERTAEADVVTTWSFKTSASEIIKYRPDPVRYEEYELIPARTTQDVEATSYPRDLDASDPNNPVFTDSSRSTIFAAGVQIGDVLSIHEEIFAYSTKLQQTVVQTGGGSQQLTAPDAAGAVFTPSMVGDLLFIEEGTDTGGYYITRFIDANNIAVDRVLQGSTASISKQGSGGDYFGIGGANIVVADPSTRPWNDADVGSYITIFGIDYRWMGSFLILEVLNKDGTGYGSSVSVQPPSGTNFRDPSIDTETGDVRWFTTAAPTTAPYANERGTAPVGTNPTGTDLVGAVPVRIYEAVSTDFPFTGIVSDAVVSGGSVAASTMRDGVSQPYQIYRPNVRRITPGEMATNQDGFLYFFDTEVISFSPSSQANLGADSYLAVDNGTFLSLGYRHKVADPSFTYSMKEAGFLDLPHSILPVGSSDSTDSLVRVIGSPMQITYERAPLVDLVQQFIDSLEDRVLSAGLLARHFLPAYLSYDATYSGGEAAGSIAPDIISYIDQLPVETSADVSEIEKIIDDHGGNPDTPTKLSATIYDWDRRMWVEFSENQLGGASPSDTNVPYNGSPRVTFFSPGQDVSGLTDIPSGERIRLTRR